MIDLMLRKPVTLFPFKTDKDIKSYEPRPDYYTCPHTLYVSLA